MTTVSRHLPGERTPRRPSERVRAVAGYFLVVYQRTWQGSLFSRFVSPFTSSHGHSSIMPRLCKTSAVPTSK